MIVLNTINNVLCILFILCYAFQFLYLLLPFVKKLPKHGKEKPHSYAALICARNEEKVIGDLIDSIRGQDYEEGKITVVVIADNCTDMTARVAREKGAVVYERQHASEIGKGYALNFGLGRLVEDFGEGAFDGYFVFDADNILEKNYVTEMNKTFSDGYPVVTSYRNSKNYGDTWLSAGSGLWFLRESKYLNGSRMRIGACPQCSGTGFLFSEEIRKANGGWPFHTLTEDYEFTCHSVTKGIKFGYCEEAVFYDDQVRSFRQSWNQRLRWTKGGLQGFLIYWKALVKGLPSKSFAACYDMLFSLAPAYLLSILATLINVIGSVVLIATGTPPTAVLLMLGRMLLGAYLVLLIQSVITTASEWRKINAHPIKKIFYVFTFPFFIMSFVPICFVALFKKVEWKQTERSNKKK